jgi:N-acyl-D-aspartate/D-glutamate deacylase
MEEPEMLLDHAAACEMLNTTERQLRRLRDERRVPFIKLGDRMIRYDSTQLAEWLELQTVRPEPKHR